MIRYRKLGPNNVVREVVVYDAQINGKEIIFSTEHYGQERIDKEMLGNTKEKAALDILDPVKDKSNKIITNQKIKDELTLIQERMDE